MTRDDKSRLLAGAIVLAGFFAAYGAHRLIERCRSGASIPATIITDVRQWEPQTMYGPPAGTVTCVGDFRFDTATLETEANYIGENGGGHLVVLEGHCGTAFLYNPMVIPPGWHYFSAFTKSMRP